jgi:hypothetical protein
MPWSPEFRLLEGQTLVSKPHITRSITSEGGAPIWYLLLDRSMVVSGGIRSFRNACEISKWITERGWNAQSN